MGKAKAEAELNALHEPWMKVATAAMCLGIPTKFVRNNTDRGFVSIADAHPGLRLRLYSFANVLELWALDHAARIGAPMEIGRKLGSVMVQRAEERLRHDELSLIEWPTQAMWRLRHKEKLLVFIVLADQRIAFRFFSEDQSMKEIREAFRLGNLSKSGALRGLNTELRVLPIDSITSILADDYVCEVRHNKAALDFNVEAKL